MLDRLRETTVVVVLEVLVNYADDTQQAQEGQGETMSGNAPMVRNC
jgi:hypothetical protein